MVTAEAIIHLPSLQHNYRYLKSLCGDNPLIAVIKGDAYGHSARDVALALPDADMFAVARIEEAIELRESGVDTEILLLEGCFCLEDLQLASRYQFQLVIHHLSQLEQFENTALDKPISVWLKLDTGMHRVGIQSDEVEYFAKRIARSTNIEGELNFLSHFSCADDLLSQKTQQQISNFSNLTDAYKGKKSIANSAGLLFWPNSHYDVARSGIALYGISPVEDQTGAELNLKPVMTLKTRLISVREHQKSQPVGYGEMWHSTQDTSIGVIAMGYGDGYPRLAPEGTPVWINGRQVPIVGRVSMDMITVDLGSESQDKIGDDVELWGSQLPIEKVAQAIGTIPYELTIKLTQRVVKTFVAL